MTLEMALRRYCAWFWDEVLPVWAGRAADAQGGFYESLDLSGAPVGDAPRRVRVQWRQVHVFATAARLERHKDAREIARRGFARACARAAPGGGRDGCAHLLAPDGRVLDDRRDLYDQAFFLLAAASHARAFPQGEGLRVAAAVRDFLGLKLAAPGGGYVEDDLGTLPRRQNPHMHLLEAFLALASITGAQRWIDDVVEIAGLLETRFYDYKAGVLREFFTADLRAPDAARGDVIEPGHMAEWVWLLERARPFVADWDRLALTLHQRAGESGRDGAGFLVNAVRLGAGAGGRRRLWPQTEYLKASLVLARRGDRDAAVCAEALVARLFETYLKGPAPGLWIDEFDAAGRPVATAVPASILYHLLEASLESEAYVRDQTA